MQEVRCKKCNKLLAKVSDIETKYYDKGFEEIPKPTGNPKHKFDLFQLEIKCPRCGEMNVRKENIKNEV